MLAAGLALAWRRTRPQEALAAIVCAMVLQSIIVGTSEASTELIIVLVAAYSAAAHGPGLPVTLVTLAVGISVHDLTDPKIKAFGDAAYDSTVLALAVLLGLATRRRQKRLRSAERTAAERAARQEEVAAAAAADERRRIARELHDIVSHSLGIVVLQAGAADTILDRDPGQARTAINLIRATALEAIGEMSRMLGVMRGEAEVSRSPQPSLEDLDTLVARAASAGLTVNVTTEGTRRVLPSAIDLSAYRILQEALTNVIKHAPKATAEVSVQYNDTELLVQVVNELGTLARDEVPSGGRGLPGIRERVAIFGGHLAAGPTPDGRWRLAAALPTQPAAVQ